MKMVRYGKSAATVCTAAGVTGFLLKQMDGTFFFRTYTSADEFMDYDIRHDDLEVTISVDALASIYKELSYEQAQQKWLNRKTK